MSSAVLLVPQTLWRKLPACPRHPLRMQYHVRPTSTRYKTTTGRTIGPFDLKKGATLLVSGFGWEGGGNEGVVKSYPNFGDYPTCHLVRLLSLQNC